MPYASLDLFSGCGGLSVGMAQAGFDVVAAVELDKRAAAAYRLNHPTTHVFEKNILEISVSEVKSLLGDKPLHLLAGCPPCQGFSSMRRLNKRKNVRDKRNGLIMEYLRLVKGLRPFTIMLENVPGLSTYSMFPEFLAELKEAGYKCDWQVVNVKNYGVPQRRRRLVLIGSRIGDLRVAPPLAEKVTVRDMIAGLPSIVEAKDSLHRITTQHTERVMKMIRLLPKNGGSRTNLPNEYVLKCHKRKGVGFKDVYGRLRWDDYSSTITGGCLNPSKGRFLHPEEDRVITPREAALLQTFPGDYKFPTDIPKNALALLIGNALPPKFSKIQSENIKAHLDTHLG